MFSKLLGQANMHIHQNRAANSIPYQRDVSVSDY